MQYCLRRAAASSLDFNNSEESGTAIRVKVEMGKSAKNNKRKEEERQAKRESPWEELEPTTDFFKLKDSKGAVISAPKSTPTRLIAEAVQPGDAGICTMTYTTFIKDHLENAKEPQEEPLAFILHGEETQFAAKFPQIPRGRYQALEWPGKCPKSGDEVLKRGVMLQMGRGTVELITGQVDFRLGREDTIELVAEWYEKDSKELQKLYKDNKDASPHITAALKKKVHGLESSIKRTYAVRPVKRDGKELPAGNRVWQAIFRIRKEISGLVPELEPPAGGGTAIKSGKEEIIIRTVTRAEEPRNDGTEPIWLPDGTSLEEAYRLGKSVKEFAGLCRNKRGLGVRVRAKGIAAARLTLLPNDDRIDAETAKVLVRMQFEVWGAHIDTPVTAVSRALRGKGWNTLPMKTKPMGQNKMITMGSEEAPKCDKTFRLPEGFLVIGRQITHDRPNPKAIHVEGTFWGESSKDGASTCASPGAGSRGLLGSLSSITPGSASGVGGSWAADPLGNSPLSPSAIAHSLVANASSSVAQELRFTSFEEEVNNQVETAQAESRHQHRTLEQWCKEEFGKLKERNDETSAEIKTIGEEVSAARKEHQEANKTMNATVIHVKADQSAIMAQLSELLARVPAKEKKKRDSTAAGLPAAAGGKGGASGTGNGMEADDG